MDRIERLRRMAREALQEYQAAITAGGEPSYPQWAEDIAAVCDLAETVATDPIRVPARTAMTREIRANVS